MANSSIRAVRETADVSRTLQEWKPKFPRLADAYEGLKWILARDPRRGLPIGDTRNPLWIYRQAARGPGLPIIEVLYAIEKDAIEIVSLRIVVVE